MKIFSWKNDGRFEWKRHTIVGITLKEINYVQIKSNHVDNQGSSRSGEWLDAISD